MSFLRFLVPAVCLFLARVAFAEVVLDDTWADGTRTDTNLPAESAWYESSSGNLAVTAGAMTASSASGSSRTWWTYFTLAGATPVQLAAGETLKVTLVFTPDQVNTGNLKRGFSVGLYDFSAGARSTGTSGSPAGANVKGYMVNVNFARTFGFDAPLEIRQRTTPGSSDLMSSSGAYTTLSAGGGSEGADAFISGTEYTLEIAATRNGSALEITARFSSPDGWSSSHTATSTADAVTSFDGFALRTTKTSETAARFVITRFKVERVPSGPAAPVIHTHPQNQTVAQGQSATFAVSASGTEPLNYQWKKGGADMPDATSATLTIPAAQGADAGSYAVVVTNDHGSLTSNAATLTVTTPVPATITTSPQSQMVDAGQSITFTVVAAGSPPLTWQWHRNGQPISGATDAELTLPNAQAADAGSYTVVVTNAGDSVTSSAALLTVNNVAPVITASPGSTAAMVGGNASFSVTARGTEPFSYQWRKDGNPITGATSAKLELFNLQETDAGSYTIAVTNQVGTTISSPAVLTVTDGLPESAYNLTGFAHATTGGGILPETDARYRKVYTPADFHAALTNSATKIIEIMNDLNLGYNEIPAAIRTGPFRTNATPLLHPVLLSTGVSLIDIQNKDGLTIFSANGAAIRHAELNVKECANVIIRNLKFEQLWEWDESSKGDYDRNDWDLVTVDKNSTNIWIDHCDFKKAYDGVVDLKGGSNKVTISWCRFLQDDGGAESWVRQQVNDLEANRSSRPMYDWLRTHGFSAEEIITISRSQKKGHLVGATEFSSENAALSVTLHHNLYRGMQDRLPRLRGGNAHVYNIQVDNRDAYAASLLYAQRAASLPSSGYKFGVTQNGAISTEGGAVFVEKVNFDGVRHALRNNQTDPNDSSYTGKIRAVDMIFNFGSTSFRGGTDTPNHPLGPAQAAVIPFSFNGFSSLPYTYSTDDPAQLPDILSIGAGAGKLLWDKTNWLKTSYAAPPPVTPSFLSWQQENFTSEELANPAISGEGASLTADGVKNLIKYTLGIGARSVAPPAMLPRMEPRPESTPAFVYQRLATATDVTFRVETTEDFAAWSENHVTRQRIAPAGANGLETWEARYTGPETPRLFFRLVTHR